jgi:hypothetical protein
VRLSNQGVSSMQVCRSFFRNTDPKLDVLTVGTVNQALDALTQASDLSSRASVLASQLFAFIPKGKVSSSLPRSDSFGANRTSYNGIRQSSCFQLLP